MAVSSRIFHKERKLGKLVNQKCIYILNMYQQTVKTFVKHFSLLHFINMRLILKQHWTSPISQQQDFIWEIYLDCYLVVKYLGWLYLLFGWVTLYELEMHAETASYCIKYFINIITSFVRLNCSRFAKSPPQTYSILEKSNANNTQMRRKLIHICET